jgi:hypothetical protein
MFHRDHPSEVNESSLGCRTERPSYLLYHIILDPLYHVDQTFGHSRDVMIMTGKTLDSAVMTTRAEK